MQRVASTNPCQSHLCEIAHLLALGYLRARKRQAARQALGASVDAGANALDDVPPQATFATGERRTSKTGVNHG